MLLTKNLSFARNSKIIFSDINLSLPNKKIIHVKGKNGAGKTTLLKVLTNILKPTNGDIFWSGTNIKKNNQIYYKNLSLIMDINTSKKELTVNENIDFWKSLFNSKIKDEEVFSLLSLLEIIDYKKALVRNLSYGERRKLELCRLIIEGKKCWIIDEPYLGLDTDATNILDETFKSHILKGGMIIFASHYSPEINNMETITIEKNAIF